MKVYDSEIEGTNPSNESIVLGDLIHDCFPELDKSYFRGGGIKLKLNHLENGKQVILVIRNDLRITLIKGNRTEKYITKDEAFEYLRGLKI